MAYSDPNDEVGLSDDTCCYFEWKPQESVGVTDTLINTA